MPDDRYGPGVALLVVDVQNEFADRRGSLYVRDGDSILPFVNSQIARAAGSCQIVYTQDWHPGSTPHFRKDGGTWPTHCVKETWGAALQEGLSVEGSIVRKGSDGGHGYSGFTVWDPRTSATSRTALESVLRQHGVDHLTIVGLATEYCVEATALDAIDLGFGVTILTEGVCAVDLEPGAGGRALERMLQAGVELI